VVVRPCQGLRVMKTKANLNWWENVCLRPTHRRQDGFRSFSSSGHYGSTSLNKADLARSAVGKFRPHLTTPYLISRQFLKCGLSGIRRGGK
jgi:hypothetical protein